MDVTASAFRASLQYFEPTPFDRAGASPLPQNRQLRERHHSLRVLEEQLKAFDDVVAAERQAMLDRFDAYQTERKTELIFEHERLVAELALAASRLPSRVKTPAPAALQPNEVVEEAATVLDALVEASYEEPAPISEGVSGNMMGRTSPRPDVEERLEAVMEVHIEVPAPVYVEPPPRGPRVPRKKRRSVVG